MTLHRSIRFALGALAGLAASTLFASQAAAQCRIEPFGDSITAGIGSTPINWGNSRWAGYRSTLAYLNPVVGLTFIGGRDDTVPESFPISTPPYYFIDSAGPWVQPYHSGVPGWTNLQLSGVVTSGYTLKPLLTPPPQIVLVHAGTNDILQGVSAADAANRLSQLLTALANRYPYAKIIVAKIIPIAGHDAVVNVYNNGLLVAPFTQGVVQKVAALNLAYPGKFSIVDMNYLYPPFTQADGIHPNDSGYAWMASKWSGAIKAVALSAGCVPRY